MATKANPVNLFFIAVGILIGLICAVAGAVSAWSTWSASANERRVEGTVVGQARAEGMRTKSGTSSPTFAPVVEYRENEQTFRIQGRVSSSTPMYTVGDKVNVVFPAGNPADGQIDSFAEKWLGSILFGGIGSVFTLISIGFLGAHLRRR